MKIDTLETHDRLLEFTKQSDYIAQGCQECIANRPAEYANHPFYIFAHKRELGLDERVSMFNKDIRDGIVNPLYIRKYMHLQNVPTARLIWEPRLTKPKAQTNSMLFRAYPPGDNIKVIWMLPQRELWSQYQKDKMTGDAVISQSIDAFLKNREVLEGKEPDELPDSLIQSIMGQIGHNARKRYKKPKPMTLAEFSSS